MSRPHRPTPLLPILGLLPALLLGQLIALPQARAQDRTQDRAAPDTGLDPSPTAPPAATPNGAPDVGSAPAPLTARPGLGNSASIVAVVNGDVISQADVDNRSRLFALSSGLPQSPDVLARLAPQVTKQLIDERLRLQEVQRRHIVVSDQEIARAIDEVEQRNGMPPGTLRHRLAADGVELRTLIDQIRVQIGWTRVLRQALGNQAEVSNADLAAQAQALKNDIGKPEYRISEIFVPVENPSASEGARKFSDTVIQQLRAGAPFAVAAAQFSQSQTALQGGDLGWVQGGEMDPAVQRVVAEMPPGAISNPIRVPGGFTIVTLRAKRVVGEQSSTVLSIRQAFLPFSTPLNQQAPTAQQRAALEQARKISSTARDCPAIEAANASLGAKRPADPGPVDLESVPSVMRAVLANLAVGHASQPLVAQDGIAVVMVCSRDDKAAAQPSKAEMTDRILGERVELSSRQLMRDLQRRAVIEQRA